jgi:hypothetical protein
VFLCLGTDYFFLRPLRIGLSWYLNVHTPPPYRWQKCQAVLHPSTVDFVEVRWFRDRVPYERVETIRLEEDVMDVDVDEPVDNEII